jgi:hypothetical protein
MYLLVEAAPKPVEPLENVAAIPLDVDRETVRPVDFQPIVAIAMERWASSAPEL